jgi:hypothetical protein
MSVIRVLKVKGPFIDSPLIGDRMMGWDDGYISLSSHRLHSLLFGVG